MCKCSDTGYEKIQRMTWTGGDSCSMSSRNVTMIEVKMAWARCFVPSRQLRSDSAVRVYEDGIDDN